MEGEASRALLWGIWHLCESRWVRPGENLGLGCETREKRTTLVFFNRSDADIAARYHRSVHGLAVDVRVIGTKR